MTPSILLYICALIPGLFPIDISTIKLDSKNNDNVTTAEISISERKMTVLNKPDSPCKTYSENLRDDYQIFYNCCRNHVWSLIRDNISCMTPIIEPFEREETSQKLRECPDQLTANISK